LPKEELLTVSEVISESIADKVGIEPGDIITSINGAAINDIIDYYILCSEEFLQLEIKKSRGETRAVNIEKDPDEDLGVRFHSDVPGGIRRCRNCCIFCFIDQLPAGMRESLYVKDDDYRHSFLYGNYISLTNLNSADWDRIVKLRLSPLYVSVHTTNPRLRVKMMRNPAAAKIMGQLKRLAEAGITVYTQVVVCPGINDGIQLERTLRDLSSLWPFVPSVAVVPVGITRFQRYEYPFFPVDPPRAREIIDLVEQMQVEFRATMGTNFAFLADELYLKAGKEIPPVEYYEDFSQMENGVGLVRTFLEDLNMLFPFAPTRVGERNVVVITGTAMGGILKDICAGLNGRVNGLHVDVLTVRNDFFGHTVDVAGLLTGRDIARALKAYRANSERQNIVALLPSVLLKAGEDVLLDDMTLEDIRVAAGVNVTAVENTARGLLSGVLGLEVQQWQNL